MKILKGVSTALMTVALTLTLGISGVAAKGLQLKDNFNNLPVVNPDLGGKWWVLNTGLYDGWYYVYNDYCGDATCVLQKGHHGNGYVSLEVYNSVVAGNYYNAELADYHTGYVYGQPTKWNPEVGKPVTLEARVRWSENYKVDGSGGAIGTSGIWLWNSPVDYINYTMNPYDEVGFNWTMEGTAFYEGLRIGSAYQNMPISQTQVNVNMQRWNVLKSVWGVNEDGSQYADSYVNGRLVNHDVLPVALHDLSVEIWNDNQKINEDWTLSYLQPTSTQAFQIDWIKVKK